MQHSIWVINDEKVIDNITDLFKTKVPCTYIADGHHRAASAAKVKFQLTDSEEAGYFLTTLFPSDQLHILSYNRVVTDLNDLSEDEFIEKLNRNFSVEKMAKPYNPEDPHNFGMYLGRKWYKLTALDGTFSTDPTGVLDISILQNNVLDPILGIKDQRTDKRIDFIGGIRGLDELEKKVKSKEMADFKNG